MRPPEGVFLIDPARAPDETTADRQPRLLWAAPGSLFTDELDCAWARRGNIADLSEVTGPWAVVLWDPTRARYVVASDPVGVQPLFCARTTDGRVAVASHLCALVDHPVVDDTMDEEGSLLDLLGITTLEVAHRSPFATVERVPWGSVVEVDQSGTWRRSRYWDPEQLPGPDRALSLDDCADLLRERIDTAVRRLLPNDGVGVGAHVSSGLDCTAVACRANHVLHEQGSSLVAGYSWAPDELHIPRLEHDERNLLDDVAAQERFPVRTIADEGLGGWFEQLDPCRYPDASHLREVHVLPAARADGVTTMLSGWGGDELPSFNGRAVVGFQARTGRWPALWRHTSARARIRAGGSVSRVAVARSFAAHVRDGLRPRPSSAARKQLTLVADRATIAQVSPLAADLFGRGAERTGAATDHHAFQLALLSNGHIQQRCAWWYQTGQLFGIDYRYPLLDLGVVNAALRLPWWAYRSEGWNRLAYRKAVAGWVPPSVAWNIWKNEPVLFNELLFHRADSTEGALPAGRRRPVDDDRYQHLVQLARRDTSARSPGSHRSLVISRPEAAPG